LYWLLARIPVPIFGLLPSKEWLTQRGLSPARRQNHIL